MTDEPVCSVEACGGVVWCRGMCSIHYNRLRASLPNGLNGKNARPLEERLWKRIEKRGDDECWPWTAKSRQSGYGWIGTQRGGHVLAHRAAWESVNGPIPKGEGAHGTVVMHMCDNRLCCNPAHLRLGTQAENVKDMRDKGRNVDLKNGRGRAHPRALPLLNDDAIREIRDRSKPRKWLADKYGIKPSNVDNIRGGRTWTHVA